MIEYELGNDIIGDSNGNTFELHVNSSSSSSSNNKNNCYLFNSIENKAFCNHLDLNLEECLGHLKERAKTNNPNYSICYKCNATKINNKFLISAPPALPVIKAGGRLSKENQNLVNITEEDKINEKKALIELPTELETFDPFKPPFSIYKTRNPEEFQTRLKSVLLDTLTFTKTYGVRNFGRNVSKNNITQLGLGEFSPHQKLILLFLTRNSPEKNMLIYVPPGGGKTCINLAILAKLLLDNTKTPTKEMPVVDKIKCFYVTASTLTENVKDSRWCFENIVNLKREQLKEEIKELDKRSPDTEVLKKTAALKKELASLPEFFKDVTVLNYVQFVNSLMTQIKDRFQIEGKADGFKLFQFKNEPDPLELGDNVQKYRIYDDLKYVHPPEGGGDPLKNRAIVIDEFDLLYPDRISEQRLKRSKLLIIFKAILYSKRVSGEQAVRIFLSSATPISINPEETLRFLDLLKYRIVENKETLLPVQMPLDSIYQVYNRSESKNDYKSLMDYYCDEFADGRRRFYIRGLVCHANLTDDLDHFAYQKNRKAIVVQATLKQNKAIVRALGTATIDMNKINKLEKKNTKERAAKGKKKVIEIEDEDDDGDDYNEAETEEFDPFSDSNELTKIPDTESGELLIQKTIFLKDPEYYGVTKEEADEWLDYSRTYDNLEKRKLYEIFNLVLVANYIKSQKSPDEVNAFIKDLYKTKYTERNTKEYIAKISPASSNNKHKTFKWLLLTQDSKIEYRKESESKYIQTVREIENLYLEKRTIFPDEFKFGFWDANALAADTQTFSSMTINPQKVKEYLNVNGPKFPALLKLINKIDQRNIKKVGAPTKIAIYCGVGGWYGAKLIASYLYSNGFSWIPLLRKYNNDKKTLEFDVTKKPEYDESAPAPPSRNNSFMILSDNLFSAKQETVITDVPPPIGETTTTTTRTRSKARGSLFFSNDFRFATAGELKKHLGIPFIRLETERDKLDKDDIKALMSFNRLIKFFKDIYSKYERRRVVFTTEISKNVITYDNIVKKPFMIYPSSQKKTDGNHENIYEELLLGFRQAFSDKDIDLSSLSTFKEQAAEDIKGLFDINEKDNDNMSNLEKCKKQMEFLIELGLIKWAPILTSDEKRVFKKKIQEQFNREDNFFGETAARIIILDKPYNTGIDLFNTPDFIKFELPLSKNEETQSDGRVKRYDGNQQMEFEYRNEKTGKLPVHYHTLRLNVQQLVKPGEEEEKEKEILEDPLTRKARQKPINYYDGTEFDPNEDEDEDYVDDKGYTKEKQKKNEELEKSKKEKKSVKKKDVPTDVNTIKEAPLKKLSFDRDKEKKKRNKIAKAPQIEAKETEELEQSFLNQKELEKNLLKELEQEEKAKPQFLIKENTTAKFAIPSLFDYRDDIIKTRKNKKLSHYKLLQEIKLSKNTSKRVKVLEEDIEEAALTKAFYEREQTNKTFSTGFYFEGFDTIKQETEKIKIWRNEKTKKYVIIKIGNKREALKEIDLDLWLRKYSDSESSLLSSRYNEILQKWYDYDKSILNGKNGDEYLFGVGNSPTALNQRLSAENKSTERSKLQKMPNEQIPDDIKRNLLIFLYNYGIIKFDYNMESYRDYSKDYIEKYHFVEYMSSLYNQSWPNLKQEKFGPFVIKNIATSKNEIVQMLLKLDKMDDMLIINDLLLAEIEKGVDITNNVIREMIIILRNILFTNDSIALRIIFLYCFRLERITSEELQRRNKSEKIAPTSENTINLYLIRFKKEMENYFRNSIIDRTNKQEREDMYEYINLRMDDDDDDNDDDTLKIISYKLTSRYYKKKILEEILNKLTLILSRTFDSDQFVMEAIIEYKPFDMYDCKSLAKIIYDKYKSVTTNPLDRKQLISAHKSFLDNDKYVSPFITMLINLIWDKDEKRILLLHEYFLRNCDNNKPVNTMSVVKDLLKNQFKLMNENEFIKEHIKSFNNDLKKDDKFLDYFSTSLKASNKDRKPISYTINKVKKGNVKGTKGIVKAFYAYLSVKISSKETNDKPEFKKAYESIPAKRAKPIQLQNFEEYKTEVIDIKLKNQEKSHFEQLEKNKKKLNDYIETHKNDPGDIKQDPKYKKYEDAIEFRQGLIDQGKIDIIEEFKNKTKEELKVIRDKLVPPPVLPAPKQLPPPPPAITSEEESQPEPEEPEEQEEIDYDTELEIEKDQDEREKEIAEIKKQKESMITNIKKAREFEPFKPPAWNYKPLGFDATVGVDQKAFLDYFLPEIQYIFELKWGINFIGDYRLERIFDNIYKEGDDDTLLKILKELNNEQETIDLVINEFPWASEKIQEMELIRIKENPPPPPLPKEGETEQEYKSKQFTFDPKIRYNYLLPLLYRFWKSSKETYPKELSEEDFYKDQRDPFGIEDEMDRYLNKKPSWRFYYLMIYMIKNNLFEQKQEERNASLRKFKNEHFPETPSY